MFVKIKQNETAVVNRFGRIIKVLNAGTHFLKPFIETLQPMNWIVIEEDSNGKINSQVKKITKIDMREMVYDFCCQSLITKDNVSVNINVFSKIQIKDVEKAITTLDVLDTLQKITNVILKELINQSYLTDVKTSTDKMNDSLMIKLNECVNDCGIEVKQINLQYVE